MTTEQIQELRRMTYGDIVRKYLPMLTRGRITKIQYDYLLSQAGRDTGPPQGHTEPEASYRASQNSGREDRAIQPDSGAPGSDAVADIISAFGGHETTHDERGTGLTQKARLLAVLKDYQWHSTTELLERVYGAGHLGIARLAARINDLRKDDYRIESKKVGGTIWSYRLMI